MRLSKLFRMLPAAAILAAAAACTETPSAPVTESAETSLARGGPSWRPSSDSGTASFWIDPRFAISGSLGDHHLSIPSNVICDPATTPYGPEHWDSPCTLATRPIRMTARWFIRNGHAQLHFTPDIRFAPAASSSKWVLLSMKQYEGEVSDASAIYWWNSQTKSWVDEALGDPVLAPWFDRGGNRVTRRVKHFSGYVVGTFRDGGDAGDGSLLGY